MYVVRAVYAVAAATLVGALVTIASNISFADQFIPGDVVVYRIGDGSSLLANTGGAVFLDEYSPSGILVQSIALPSVASGANQPLIASGTAVSEGMLTLSTDGRYLLLTGYATTLPASGSLSSTAGAMVPRTVGRVGFDGSVDTSTALADFADGNNPRSAVSTDGTQLWLGGAAGGVRYTTLGSTSSTELSTDSKNIRQVNIFDGQLYISTQKGALRVATVGTGIPTTAGQSITNLPGFPVTGTPDAFVFADLDGAPGVDTLYVADDTTAGGQIQKYTLLGGNWVASGTIDAANVHGLTGVVSGTAVTLYATTSGIDGTSGTLYTFTDTSGYDGNASGAVNTLATALTNEAFRGLAMAPVGAVLPTPTPMPTPTPTSGSLACVGDCSGSGEVSVNDLITMVNIALGSSPLSVCVAGDADKSGEITINEIIAAINNALNGC